MTFEENLVEFCAPTLAGIKCGSLFMYKYESLNELDWYTKYFCHILRNKGVSVCILKHNPVSKSALIYVYRKCQLKRILKDEANSEFLSNYGYHEYNVRDCLARLQIRLANSEVFPHEIGIFLDYPISDVRGFIEQKGHNYLCCGYWKVYEDEEYSRCMFAKYDLCRSNYRKCYYSGISLGQITVAI